MTTSHRTGLASRPAGPRAQSLRTIPALALALGLLLAGAGPASAAPETGALHLASDPGTVLHLRLDSTEPAADAVLPASPEEIRLFFSEPPQMQGTSVRLADAGGELVATTEAAADEGDAREVFIVPAGSLAPGRYTVHWRVIAQDGHAQRGDFDFEVRGTR
jgi:copper resistance protein C